MNKEWIDAQLKRCHEQKKLAPLGEVEKWSMAIASLLHLKKCPNRHSSRQPFDPLPDSRPLCTDNDDFRQDDRIENATPAGERE